MRSRLCCSPQVGLVPLLPLLPCAALPTTTTYYNTVYGQLTSRTRPNQIEPLPLAVDDDVGRLVVGVWFVGGQDGREKNNPLPPPPVKGDGTKITHTRFPFLLV